MKSGVFSSSKYSRNSFFGRGSVPDPAGGPYDALPDPLVGWGGGHPISFPSCYNPNCELSGLTLFFINMKRLLNISDIGKHSILGNLCLPQLEKSGNFMWSGKWSPCYILWHSCWKTLNYDKQHYLFSVVWLGVSTELHDCHWLFACRCWKWSTCCWRFWGLTLPCRQSVFSVTVSSKKLKPTRRPFHLPWFVSTSYVMWCIRLIKTIEEVLFCQTNKQQNTISN